MSDDRAAVLVPETPFTQEIRELLIELAALLDRAERAGVVLEVNCAALIEQVDEPFSVFVCGEFNSGKSSLINSLVGEAIAPVGVLPTTTSLVRLTSEMCAGLGFVDSPGTNSIISEHQAATESFLQRSDVVLFVTSVERPLAESELRFLREIRDRWQREIVVAVNKSDLLKEEERVAVRAFVSEGLSGVFGRELPLHLVSARDGSGITELRDTLRETFASGGQLAIKLRAVLGSVQVYLKALERGLKAAGEEISAEHQVLQKLLERCERRRGEGELLFAGFPAQVEQITNELSNRVEQLVDQNFGLLTLVRRRLFSSEDQLREQVRAAIDELEVEQRFHSLVEESAQKLSVFERIMHSDIEDYLAVPAIKASVSFRFSPEQSRPIDARQIAADLKSSTERGLQRALALGSVAAVSGIGAKIAAASTVEITGMLLMVVLGVLGLRAVPAEKRSIKIKLRESFKELGQSFADSLRGSIKEYLESALGRIVDQLRPELERAERHENRNKELLAEVGGVRERREKLLGKLSEAH